MKKSTQNIVKNLSLEIVSTFETNYFELYKTYSKKEIYSITVEQVLSSVLDTHKLNVIKKYERSIGRKSNRLVREFMKTL